jgi:hypothetical protein
VVKPQAPAVAVIPSTEPVQQSILRRTSHEGEAQKVEPAPIQVEVSARPLLITTRPAPVVSDYEIPHNPLR